MEGGAHERERTGKCRGENRKEGGMRQGGRTGKRREKRRQRKGLVGRRMVREKEKGREGKR